MEPKNYDEGRGPALDLRYVVAESAEGMRRFFSPVRNVREIKSAVRMGADESSKSIEEIRGALSAITWKGLLRMIFRMLKKLLKPS
jgi:hypothetical protein